MRYGNFNCFVCLTGVAVTGVLGKMGVLSIVAKIWDEREQKVTNVYFTFFAFPLKNKGRKKISDTEVNETRFCNYRKKVWFCLRLFMFVVCFFLNNIFIFSGRGCVSLLNQ